MTLDYRFRKTAVRHRVTGLTRARVIKNTVLTDPVKLGMLAAELHIRVGGRAPGVVAAAVASLPEADFVALATGLYSTRPT